ncbi:calpain-A-like [Argopecten irradians]|uniref:calpain-A-like n=1 Tax=Argopecten irradians TaxID=31199 RepID=UPI003714D8DD
MGSTPSKHKTIVRTKSEPQLRVPVISHVPVRRAVSAISPQVTALHSAKLSIKSSEDPPCEIPEEEYKDGQLGISSSKRIRKKLHRLRNGELFCDEDFPADRDALFYSDKPEPPGILWKRPKDIVEEWDKPFLILDGLTRDDIKQGKLADCWFLSACAAVSQREIYIKKIIPGDQPLFGEGYQGIVRFQFWRFGQYVDVYVDDRLPTIDGKLIYARCTNPREFWVALIEKAYAKLHGSYEAIHGGHVMNALVDLTGGLAECHEVISKDPTLYRHIDRAIKSDAAFVACSRKGDWRLGIIADPNGLVSGHAYTVTDSRKIKHERGEEKLLRIRNPWANSEWKGSWSDNDVNWHLVDEETKKEIGLQLKDDGEFWMSYRDFCKQFQQVTICLLGSGNGTSKKCHMEMVKGEWILGRTAGGSIYDLARFSTNPQYVLTLLEPDDFDETKDDPENEGLCTIVISLMQEHRRSKRNVKVKSLQIGFFIYKIQDPSKKLNVQHFRYNRECGKSGSYINYREVSQRFELEPGHYVIIPSAFSIDESRFLLRVFGEKKFSLSGPIEDIPAVQMNGHSKSAERETVHTNNYNGQF